MRDADNLQNSKLGIGSHNPRVGSSVLAVNSRSYTPTFTFTKFSCLGYFSKRHFHAQAHARTLRNWKLEFLHLPIQCKSVSSVLWYYSKCERSSLNPNTLTREFEGIHTGCHPKHNKDKSPKVQTNKITHQKKSMGIISETHILLSSIQRSNFFSHEFY